MGMLDMQMYYNEEHTHEKGIPLENTIGMSLWNAFCAVDDDLAYDKVWIIYDAGNHNKRIQNYNTEFDPHWETNGVDQMIIRGVKETETQVRVYAVFKLP